MFLIFDFNFLNLIYRTKVKGGIVVNREKKNFEKGITLIALVITIIILLILAGISIAMLTGDNGILTKASNSKEQTAVARNRGRG